MLRTLQVNGFSHQISVVPGTPLLQVLREALGLTGTKEACGRGECGACTVLLDGKPVLSCLALVDITHGNVTTIEGLADTAADLRRAFADFGAFQCGFCTPGQIVCATALLAEEWPERSDEVERFVRRRMSGNICRCTGYTGIVDAILHVRAARRGTVAGRT